MPRRRCIPIPQTAAELLALFRQLPKSEQDQFWFDLATADDGNFIKTMMETVTLLCKEADYQRRKRSRKTAASAALDALLLLPLGERPTDEVIARQRGTGVDAMRKRRQRAKGKK